MPPARRRRDTVALNRGPGIDFSPTPSSGTAFMQNSGLIDYRRNQLRISIGPSNDVWIDVIHSNKPSLRKDTFVIADDLFLTISLILSVCLGDQRYMLRVCSA